MTDRRLTDLKVARACLHRASSISGERSQEIKGIADSVENIIAWLLSPEAESDEGSRS